MTDLKRERQHLLKALRQLEQDGKAVDLRDRINWNAYEQKLSELRQRIATFERHVSAEDAPSSPSHVAGAERPAVTASRAPTPRASPRATLRRRPGGQ
jgi:hypothetical protein